jgi:hypothetical protein
LLSTPSLDDAVTSGYGQPVLCPKRTFTSLFVCAFRRTPQPPSGLGGVVRDPRVASEGNLSPLSFLATSTSPGRLAGLVCRTPLVFPTRRLAEEMAKLLEETLGNALR